MGELTTEMTGNHNPMLGLIAADCVYIHNERCPYAVVASKDCSPLSEAYSRVVLAILSAKGVHCCYHSRKQQTAYPDGLLIIAGNFSHANLKTVLPNFHQHVKLATRRKNKLDLVDIQVVAANECSLIP